VDLRAWLTVLLLLACSACSRPSQIGGDETAFHEVDALYTAVTSRRTDLLDASWERLTKLHAEKRVTDAAFRELKQIVDQARHDEWKPAAERLWTFMRGQRKPRE